MRTSARMWGRPRGGDRPRAAGVALLMVTAAITLLGALAMDFQYDTTVDYASAANARDDMRAHFLAVSGMNLSRLVTKVQHDIIDRYRRHIGDLQLADYLPLIMGAFGGTKEEVEALAGAIGGIDTGGIKGLGVTEGQFDVEVKTDDGKINVNCANGTATTQKQLELMLTALFAPTAHDRMFEERDGDGQFTDRAMLMRAIIDWVDRDQAAYGLPGQPEAYGYESLADPHKPRDNYIDSIDELQLVRGMDDRRWELFGPAFTAYGGCKVNIGAANDLGVLMALIFQAAKDPNHPVLRDYLKLFALAQRLAQARGFGYMFDDLASFAELAKNPDAVLEPILAIAGGASPTGMLAPVEGVELDEKKLAQVARAGGRRTYHVVTRAKVGRVAKTITGIFDTETQNQNARDQAYARGAWVYWREE